MWDLNKDKEVIAMRDGIDAWIENTFFPPNAVINSVLFEYKILTAFLRLQGLIAYQDDSSKTYFSTLPYAYVDGFLKLN
jgi:hypothetical protein